MKTAYLDCFSGISGNMLLGALLQAGLEEDDLRRTLAALPVSGVRLEIKKVSARGLAALQVRVHVDQDQPHRHLRDIKELLQASTLADPVKQRSLAVFTRLAEAEAVVHGTTPDAVHFHEVGAVDALVDVVGVVAGFHQLQIDTIFCSPLPMSGGWTSCAHGEIPLPAPAVCGLLKDVPVYGVELQQELVTPTGAALACELADDFGPMPAMTMGATGYGAGTSKRTDGRPNLLRLCIGLRHEVTEAGEVEVLETHIDDWNPETWPHVSRQLMIAGALDVSLTPIQMKKGRPGFRLKVLCEPALSLELKQVIFSETTAIGLRFHRQQRMTLPRRKIYLKTPWGEVEAKEIQTPAGPLITPEYESCSALAISKKIPLRSIYDACVQAGATRDNARKHD
ncbi:MAG TPA: nickel pincer cofactor biosynthesis protein LarC [Desulfobulbus sp.]|nr:nickel pincer cofactor biosynthesis protein LarC [Desulfobulbus sp.]